VLRAAGARLGNGLRLVVGKPLDVVVSCTRGATTVMTPSLRQHNDESIDGNIIHDNREQ